MTKLKDEARITVSMGTILEYAWLILKNHLYLLTLVALSLFVIFTLAEYQTIFVSNSSLSFVFDFIVLLTGAYILLIIFYVLSQPTVVLPSVAVAWFIKNFVWYTWTLTLLITVLIFGYVFLVIPGIILSIYLVFVPIIFFDKKLSGLPALEYSMSLVYRQWWSILYRVLILTFLTLLFTLAVFVALVMIVDILPIFTGAQDLLTLLVITFSLAASLVFWAGGILRIYNAVKNLSNAELLVIKEIKLFLRALSILGSLTLLILLVLTWF